MKQTTNYLMHLPEPSDYADIGVLDENTVKIDGELWKKADKHAPAAAGNLAALDAAGNLADAGKKPGDFAPATHTHPAGDISGLPAAIAGKADKMVPGSVGNLAALDASGNLADAGKKPGDFSAAKHTHSRGDISNFSHTHSAGDIASGVLPIARGGTGGNTADSALNALGAERIGFLTYVGNSKSMREINVGQYMKWAYLCLSTGVTGYQNNPVEDSIVHGGLLSPDYPLVTGHGSVCAQLFATSLRLFQNDSCSGVNLGNGSNARYEYYCLYGY